MLGPSKLLTCDTILPIAVLPNWALQKYYSPIIP